MAEKTKIYISTRVIAPPASGGAFQFTAFLANAIASNPTQACLLGATNRNVAAFQKLLSPYIECKRLVGECGIDLIENEEALLRDLSPDRAFFPYPGVDDKFPASSFAKRCVCVFDLQHLEWREFFPPAERWKRDKAFSKAIRCADLLATISRFSATQIAKYFEIPEERICVIYSGASNASGNQTFPPATGEFLLYPANLWPHKNHSKLLEIFQILRRKHPDLRLILTGDKGKDRDFHRKWASIPGVEHLGFVSQEKLKELMATARCLVFPSLYEGFGMPVIEALQLGTPVACSNTTSLPEVGGDLAEYFDPSDAAQMAQAIERAISNASNPEWQERAKRQSEKFNFERSAKLLLEAMEERSSRGPDPEVIRRRSTSLRLDDYWQCFPSLDAILLPVGSMDSSECKVEDFKALNRLDIARLNPISMGALFARGQNIAANGKFKTLTFNVYRQILCLVAEGKLVVHLPQVVRSGEAQKISRLTAIQALFWQFKILRRTCREAVLAVVTGKWENQSK